MPGLQLSALLGGEFLGWLWSGFLTSLALAACTLALALPLGTVVALMRLSGAPLWRALGFGFVEGIRSVPLLVHLLFWYFGAPELLPETARRWLYSQPTELVCAVVGLTLYTAAYMAEDVRSGIRSIPVTQLEAGRALGFGFLATMGRVVLPQALRVTVPPLISQTLNLWKNTSIATVIGAAELMYQAQRVETASFRGVETFFLATLAYLSVSLLITGLASLYAMRYPVRSA